MYGFVINRCSLIKNNRYFFIVGKIYSASMKSYQYSKFDILEK